MSTERMSPVDRAWLLMERPTNPMVIVAVIVLEARLTRARLARLIERRLLVHERFRCRPVSDTFSGEWLPAADFELADHVLRAALPAPGGQRELEALVGELAGAPFNESRPRWSFHVVETFGAGSAIVARIHHCYADGIALMRVLLGLADGPRPRAATRAAPATSAAPAGLLAGALRGGVGLVELGTHWLLHPGDAVNLAGTVSGAMSELAKLALVPDDPPSALRRPLSGARRVAWSAPLPLDAIKAVGRAHECTINDVLMATLAGALAGYLRARRQRVRGLTLHAAVPVNLRTDDDPGEPLGNRFGLVFVELPVGVRTPLARLRRVHAAMREIKGSAQAALTHGLLATVGGLPPAVEGAAIEAFTAKASLVVSNVPGPREPVRLCGVRVRQLLFWVPQAGGIGTGVSLLSYAGQVQFGVMTDRRLVAEPAEIAAGFVREFERLAHAVESTEPLR